MASRRDISSFAEVTMLDMISENAVEVMDQYAPGASRGEKRTRRTANSATSRFREHTEAQK